MTHRSNLLCPLAALAAIVTVAPARAADAPTYSRDVAPIFFESCAQCHRPGAVAPMSLLTYQDARPWAKAIAKQVHEPATCRPGAASRTATSGPTTSR